MKAWLQKHRDAVIVGATALSVRMAVVVWAAERIVPTADGDFYHVIAKRIAAGDGYTWLWPDGVVTYAGHYPVGYPALLGLAYAVLGGSPWVGMVMNAALGTMAALAAHGLALEASTRKRALVAGLLVALHVALVPYTAALMTEGAVASLWVAAAWLAMTSRRASGRGRWAWLSLLGLVLGAAALMRPQTLLLMPLLAWLGALGFEGWRRRLAAAAVCAMTLLTTTPWVVRNEVRMGEAGLSFNGGWNLLIGSDPEARGTFAELKVPDECREVFDEAKKDKCFGQAAARRIVANPIGWISLAPKKLGATFDYCGAAGWYLHASNAKAFPYRAKVVLGALETVFIRVCVLAALIAMAVPRGPRRRMRAVAAAVGAISLFTPAGWPAVLALLASLSFFGRSLGVLPVAVPAAASAVGVTVATHVVFFGAGRYSMVVFPLIAVLVAGIRRPANGGSGGLSQDGVR